jgi:hypothetical protein
MTAKLTPTTCWGCGTELKTTSAGEYGVICGGCGTINPWPHEQAEGPREQAKG